MRSNKGIMVTAMAAALLGCGAETQGRANMLAGSGELRVDPVAGAERQQRITLRNSMDIGYDAADRQDRLAVARTATGCPALKVLEETTIPPNSARPMWFVLRVEC